MTHPKTSQPADVLTIERRGDITVVTANPELEASGEGLEEMAAALLVEPLKAEDEPVVIFDLSQVNYFGSVFLAILIRCWKIIRAKSGTMVLAGVSSHAKELLHVTSLDQAWAIYKDRREAIEALTSD
jgi:anti-sigma B factor antagonist